MNKNSIEPLLFKEEFLDALPGLKLAVYGFGKTLSRYARPTSDMAPPTEAMNTLRSGRTGEQVTRKDGLHEALLAVLNEAASTPGQASRIVVFFSDGAPDAPVKSGDAAALANKLGITVYPVVFGHANLLRQLFALRQAFVADAAVIQQQNSKSKNAPNQTSKRLLKLQGYEVEVNDFIRLGDLTAGRTFDPPEFNMDVMARILAAILQATRTQYTVGFAVDGKPNPKKHKMEVRLANPQNGAVTGGKPSLSY